MDYIVFDLELNSKPFKNRHPNEIIEIGAVKLNDNLEETGNFQCFVRPRLYKKLFSVVKNKTGINQEDISGAIGFRKAVAQFREWMGTDYILCSWGHDDIHHMRQNCKFNHMGAGWINQSIDVQKQVSRIFGLVRGTAYSLENALKALDIPVEGQLHRADSDARYTAEIFRRIFTKLEL